MLPGQAGNGRTLAILDYDMAARLFLILGAKSDYEIAPPAIKANWHEPKGHFVNCRFSEFIINQSEA